MLITDLFVFFYTNKDYMSNFYPSQFTLDNVKFSCTEQYMMYHKALLFGDKDIAEKILADDRPLRIKALGRSVSGFDEAVWKANREIIMFNGNLGKYSQNEDLKKQLIETNPKELVEASPSDKIWGIGLGINDPKIHDKIHWVGLNLLGVALMKVRSGLLN